MQCSKQRSGRGWWRDLMAGMVQGLTACWAVLLLAACSGAPQAPSSSLQSALQRGVNLGDWWTDSSASAVIGAPHHPVADDYVQIRTLGFGHVRVPVASHRLAEGAGGRFSASKVAALRSDLEAVLDSGLAVILAVQMNDDEKLALLGDAGQGRAFARDWTLLADSLADLPANKLVFELLNEPTSEDAEAWQALQRKLLTAVREVAPRHTIMLTGAHYSDLDDLERLRPVDDGNVIYSFHFYTPHNFTHQGATWGWPPWRLLAGLPYPANEALVAPLLETAPKPARQHIVQYGRETWNQSAISAELSRARLWADQHDVLIHCTEFGVIAGAPADSRARWLEDVRSVLEANEAGWTVWGYASRFAIASPEGTGRSVPPALQQALGLQ